MQSKIGKQRTSVKWKVCSKNDRALTQLTKTEKMHGQYKNKPRAITTYTH